MTTEENQASWLAAIIAPWTQSPHPNFTEETTRPQAQLALVVERRYESVSAADEAEQRFEFEWFVELTESSLYYGSQVEATEKLWTIAEDDAYGLGMRYVAAMFGTLGLSELDRTGEACLKLETLFEAVTAGQTPDSMNPDDRLIVAAISQQRLTRLKEVARLREAQKEVHRVEMWLPDEAEDRYRTFEVSKGISWDSVQVLRDIRHTLSGQAQADKAHLEFPSGSSWAEVVTGRSGWIELRRALMDVSRESFFVRDVFEDRFDSMSGRITFRQSSTDERAYASLLVSELAGASSRIIANREVLGRIRLLEAEGDVVQTREALRLLRLANSKQALQSALKRVRQEGPSEALRVEAGAILRRGADSTVVSSSDLLVLDYASDFLSSQELQESIEIALKHPSTETLTLGGTAPAIDTAWKTIARLLPGSNEDNRIAGLALEATDSAAVYEPMVRTLARVVHEIVWEDVSSEVIARWKEWCAKSELPLLRDAVLRAMDEDVVYGSPVSMLDAALLADDGIGNRPESHLSAATNVIVDSITEDIKRAAAGGYSIGGVDSGDVAVAFALKFGIDEVWDAVVRMLLDARLDAAKKDSALERIARNSSRVPMGVKEKLAAAWSNVEESDRARTLVGGLRLPWYPQALRAGSALKIVAPNDFLMRVMELGAAGEPGRVEAAKTIGFGREIIELAWAQSLLLQFSFDASADVRAEAAASLVMTLEANSNLTPLAVERLENLRQGDGVRIPVRILSVLRSMPPNPLLQRTFESWLRQLRDAGQPRVLARGASILLREWEIDSVEANS